LYTAFHIGARVGQFSTERLEFPAEAESLGSGKLVFDWGAELGTLGGLGVDRWPVDRLRGRFTTLCEDFS
jgi:hypothetical protein